MKKTKPEIKLALINGLKDIVLKEISQYPDLHIIKNDEESIYLDFVSDFTMIKHLRSVTRAYVVVRSTKYNPFYITKHKSILGDLMEMVLSNNKDKFKSFKITCAGSNSSVVRNIAKYVQETYKFIEKEEADIKVHIIKLNQTWEIGIQITPRPLSFRDYKIQNMSGAMDPTIAYAMNSLCELENVNSYLNIFSGSATLLIEAGQCYPNLKRLIGFDNNKKYLSLAIQNIKKAKLITKIQLKEKNIFDKPSLGIFDVITSDLPFGMTISKGENLEKLYQCFINYCESVLNQKGKLVAYTTEHETLKEIISTSRFYIVKTLELKLVTNVNSYLRPKIFVCKLKS